jgi:hypothetical protein
MIVKKTCLALLLLMIVILTSCSKDPIEKSDLLPILERNTWFSEKIWCHRVNTIEKIQRVEEKWKGLELDIYFENEQLIVKHDFEDTTNLTLQKYMVSLKDSHAHYFWFDLKNINSENYKELSSLLISAINKYSNINNCVVESWVPDLMQFFVEEGCHTSFFINLSNLTTDEEVQNRISEITQYVKRNRIAAISSSIYDYNLMKDYFPDFNKLTWFSNNDFVIADSLKAIVNNDVTMQVCLFEEGYY